MNIFIRTIVVSALFLNSYVVIGKRDDVNAKGDLDLKGAIEKFLNDLQSSIPEVFTFADQNITVPNNKYIKGTFNFSSVSFTGLKEFNATVFYHSFLPLPKAYLLTLENLCLNFSYKSDITLSESKYLSFFGEGDVSVSLKKLTFEGNVSVSILPANATGSVNIDLDIVLVNVTGLLDDQNFSSDFGTFLGKSITTIFDANKKFLSETLTNALNFVLQQVLKHRHYFNEDKSVRQPKFNNRGSEHRAPLLGVDTNGSVWNFS